MARKLTARALYARALSPDQFGKPYEDLSRSEKLDALFFTDEDFARLKKAGLEVVPRKVVRVKRRAR